MTTGFFTDERCFWHGGGNYVFTVPVGGLVEPLEAGGLPESPSTKRRFRNLVEVTGLAGDLHVASAAPASEEDLLRVHPRSYLDAFRALSDAGGGELGERTPFGPGGYEIAALSAGLTREAVFAVLEGRLANAYALSRPPGHHCLPDRPMGFCLLANIAIAVEAARAAGLASRIAVVDWDVHHGNGTEAIFADDEDVLTISLHQQNNYPFDSGGLDSTARGNINIPLPPGAGHASYVEAMERVVVPALARHRPDIVIVACGFDASGVDPLGRMLLGSHSFAAMTDCLMDAARDLCGGRLVMAHEGGYSDAHVPFCGHAVLERMSGSDITAPDPLLPRILAQQPDTGMDRVVSERIAAAAAHYGL